MDKNETEESNEPSTPSNITNSSPSKKKKGKGLNSIISRLQKTQQQGMIQTHQILHFFYKNNDAQNGQKIRTI